MINQHSEDDLCELQNTLVDKIIASRPDSSFLDEDHTSLGTFDGYVARQLYYHIQGALSGTDEPKWEWLGHRDTIIKKNYANAVGFDKLSEIAAAEAEAGNRLNAAFAAYASSLRKDISGEIVRDKMYQAADMLEQADDKDALQFEMEVLGR